MKTSLKSPKTATNRRRAGWTAFAPLPVAIATLLVVPILALAPAIDDSIWTDVGPALRGCADSVTSFASGLFEAVSDPETLVRGVTGNRIGSIDVE